MDRRSARAWLLRENLYFIFGDTAKNITKTQPIDRLNLNGGVYASTNLTAAKISVTGQYRSTLSITPDRN
jgi:hypothetical protein